MQEIWGWIDTWQGTITEIGWKMATETVRLSKQTGEKPCAIISHITAEKVKQFKRMGISKVYLLQPSSEVTDLTTLDSLPALSQLLVTQQPSFLLFPSHATGNEWAARLSLRFHADLLGEVVEYSKMRGQLQFRKQVHAGKVHGLYTCTGERFTILTLALSSLEQVEQPVREIEMVECSYQPEPSGITLQQTEAAHWRELSLQEADFIIGVGRGVDHVALQQIEELAERWNCAIGGSKVADESGLIHREYRIGASGKTINSPIYLAIGISGAPHHLAGIKGVKHVAVINPDLAAPITEQAEVVVGFPHQEIIPHLLKEVGE